MENLGQNFCVKGRFCKSVYYYYYYFTIIEHVNIGNKEELRILTCARAYSSSLWWPELFSNTTVISKLYLSTWANFPLILFKTHAGLSSRMSAVVDSGSKSRFFLTFCFGEGGLLGRPALSSYSWDKETRDNWACPVLIWWSPSECKKAVL